MFGQSWTWEEREENTLSNQERFLQRAPQHIAHRHQLVIDSTLQWKADCGLWKKWKLNQTLFENYRSALHSLDKKVGSLSRNYEFRIL